MVEKTKKHKKGTISEEDIANLLHRYSATTVLALLQEVAQFPDSKIDWKELVKKTRTGISNAREYQMLWRHLAYRDALVDKLDDGAEPMDDDSDLECELEAFPPVSNEALTEAAACVKVLIASGLQSDSSLLNGLTVEAPLTINIPNSQLSRAPADNAQMQGTNITIPVSVQKQVPNVTSTEGLDGNGSASGNMAPRRKRKLWSEAEDLELIAAVQKCGEGNWANILKGDFKGDRTASQLSQRWAIIRKRQGNLHVGGGSQLSEAQLAARRAVSLALNMPMVDNLKSAITNGTNPNTTSNNSTRPAAVESSPVAPQSQPQSRQDSAPTTLSKARVITKKPSAKPPLSPDAMVKAAAVAAGARIATPSDAASLFKAAQAKKAVHIMPGGGSMIKSSIVGSSNALPPNVHFIRAGRTSSTSPSVYPASRPGGTQQTHSSSAKPAAQIGQSNATSQIGQPNLPDTARESNPLAEVTVTRELKANDSTTSGSGNLLREQVQETQAAFSGVVLKDRVEEDCDSVMGNVPDEHIQDQASDFKEQVEDEIVTLFSSEMVLKSPKDSVENIDVPVESDKGEDTEMIDVPFKEGPENGTAVGKT
ncbi:hypothetical protein NMG60_11031327 [Bertholletia excelsa]